MARLLDKVVVVDVEATCWHSKPPEGSENEIIEIGVCVLDLATGEREEKESIVVRPEHSKVSEYCTQITGWTQEKVEKGISFAEACEMLKEKYRTKVRTWASYGDYDRNQFQRQCAARGIDYPFGPTHINVKNWFALKHGLKHELGMAQALNLLDLPLEGKHHRGDDDAWNIALILSKLIKR
jgi:inhibitor of KinA sporulation pathway (predicted exonuclease)